MKVPHPIPYQGSKRKIARYVLACFPRDIDTLIEPFAGSAAITIAAASLGKASRFYINDLNAPLMSLWEEIINDPQGLSGKYAHLWEEQQENAREYYDLVRDKFNATHKPEYLLYLLARCVKASVRIIPKGNSIKARTTDDWDVARNRWQAIYMQYRTYCGAKSQ